MTPELMRIVALCREAAKLGLNVGMSDARPAMVIRTAARPPLWITVGDSGEFFEWHQHRHPVTDPAGAAALIRKCLVS
jgi:hypothetical protein